MKKLLSLVMSFCMLAVAGARADEGMWLLPLLKTMNSDQMTQLGCHLSAEQIYSINHSSLKDAVVQFGGGCTGEVISAEGLLVTNHHCGYASIQALSSPEHNYLEDGYWAMNRSEELPAPGLTVTFLQSMQDVTKLLSKTEPKLLTDQAEEDNPGCKAVIMPFYNENVFYLLVYKTYRDIRFVGAPPSSLGKFGGDTDNWMWPRQTCDFSMFRIYAGADNQPADYSPDNRPYRPTSHLQISMKGVQDHDFAMIMGYPGRTQRFQTEAQLRKMLDVNDVRIDARTVRQDVIWEARMADPVINLKYANKYASSSNYWKKWQGMRDAFAKLDILERQKTNESDFLTWCDAKQKRAEKYGSAIDDIASCVEDTRDDELSLALLTETLMTIELPKIARHPSEDAWKDYDADLDRKVAKAVLAHYESRVNPLHKVEVPDIDYMFDHSAYTSLEKYNQAVSEGTDLSKDPAVTFLDGILPAGRKLSEGANSRKDALDKAAKTYTAGQLEWKKGHSSYPDANFTMRLTYGQVLSYEPKDGVLYKHYTTLDGVMEKADSTNYDFRIPAGLSALYKARDYGRYADADGKLHACFLTNCDITGGNSGSPVMNADGQLIGLAFDGNWEAMSSDVMFEPNLQRCICVDIRYVLFAMDKLGGAGYLLDEMDIAE